MSAAPQRLMTVTGSRPSALIAKFAAFVPLDDAEAFALQNCEQEVHRLGRRKTIRRQGETVSDLFVLRSGWAFSFAVMPDGGRQILDLHFPGDLIGHSSIAFDSAPTGIGTVTQVELCPVSRAEYADLFQVSPRLATALHAMSLVENAILIDRLKSIGRMEARDRLAYLFLQILTRLEMTGMNRHAARPASRELSVVGGRRVFSDRNSFQLPMSQELIGDALGLSAIHVNRTLRRLENEGDLFRDHQQMTLLKREKLADSVSFTNRYAQFATSWMPE